MVNEVLSNNDCELTEEFLRFKDYYGFITAFCSLGKGIEMPNVENKVGTTAVICLFQYPRYMT